MVLIDICFDIIHIYQVYKYSKYTYLKNCGRSHNRHSAILLNLSSDFGDSTIPFLFAAAISSLEAKAFLAASVGKYLSTNLWITPRCFTRLEKFKTKINLKLFSGTYIHKPSLNVDKTFRSLLVTPYNYYIMKTTT